MTVEGHTDDTDGTDFLWLAENAESAERANNYGYGTSRASLLFQIIPISFTSFMPISF